MTKVIGLLIPMMSLNVLCLLVPVQLLLVSAEGSISNDNLSWTVYHSWDTNQEYKRRGTLQWDDETSTLKMENEHFLSTDEIKEMVDYGWYHVKIDNVGSSSTKEGEEDYVMSTIPACNVRRANFKDEFELTVPTTKDGQITSLAYTASVSPLAPKNCLDMELFSTDESKMKWNTKVKVTLDTPGMVIKNILPNTKPPPGLAFISHPNNKKKKVGGAGGAGGAGPAAEPEPLSGPWAFIQRYWYILLPLFLANFLGPAEDPNQQQQEGQQGGSGGNQGSTGGGASATASAPAAAATPTTAAPSSGGGGGKRGRRGKRG